METKTERILDDLGILPGINEVIVTTEREGIPNAAPIGIIRDDNIRVRLFLGTHTYENVLATGLLVANVSHDPMIFVEAAMSDLEEDCFVRREGVLTLKDAETWALFRCSPYRTDIIMPELEFVKGGVVRKEFRAINRGVSCVIEAAIAATRYNALRADSYLEEIRRLKRIVQRCGGPREIAAMKRLEEYIVL